MKKLVLIIVLSVFIGCSPKSKTTEEKEITIPENTVVFTDAEIKTAGIVLGKPEKGTTSSILKVSGVIDVPPQNMVSISSPFGGYLSSTRLIPGMKVNKGQPIAEMQDQLFIQMQQDYLVARSKVGFLKKEYERQKALNATKTTSDKVLEQVESEYRTQRIMMNSLKEKLELINIETSTLHENNIRRSVMIYSPITGYVSAVYVNPGKYVNPPDVLFELVKPDDLHLAVKVFEKDISSIKIGQKLTVQLVNNPGRIIEAEVKLISRQLDDDRSALVHCHLINPGSDLLPGMFANATIETMTREAIMIPEDAVVRWGNKQYVFVQKEKGRFEMAEVSTGTITKGKTDIQSGLPGLLDETIIKTNAYAALMKLQNKAE